MKSLCPLCSTRKAKRACPGIRGEICAVCCGTKRLIEIACPPDCPYLSSARAHPPAVVQRQRDRDMQFVVGHIADLTETQYRLMLFAQAMILRQDAEIVPKLHDTDVADAVAATAATLETSRAGIIYQHHAASAPAERLAGELGKALGAVAQEAGANAARFERDAAVALRRLEQVVRSAAQALTDAVEPERSWVALAVRMMGSGSGETAEADPAAKPDDAPRIIMP